MWGPSPHPTSWPIFPAPLPASSFVWVPPRVSCVKNTEVCWGLLLSPRLPMADMLWEAEWVGGSRQSRFMMTLRPWALPAASGSWNENQTQDTASLAPQSTRRWTALSTAVGLNFLAVRRIHLSTLKGTERWKPLGSLHFYKWLRDLPKGERQAGLEWDKGVWQLWNGPTAPQLSNGGTKKGWKEKAAAMACSELYQSKWLLLCL